jgi:hypothetical protein
MNSEPCSLRFDPRLRPSIAGTDGAGLFELADAAFTFEVETSPDDPTGRDVDLALAQIVAEGCRVCPLCRAFMAGDKSVLD